MVDFTIVEELLEEINGEFEDPEAQYEFERMQDHYYNALRAEYLRDKEKEEYDF